MTDRMLYSRAYIRVRVIAETSSRRRARVWVHVKQDTEIQVVRRDETRPRPSQSRWKALAILVVRTHNRQAQHAGPFKPMFPFDM
jgi:hypothetical protein